MTKDISTLKRDIYHVLQTGEGYTEEIEQWVADDFKRALHDQFNGRGERKRTLRVSSLGTECERKLWYSTRGEYQPEPIPASTYNKFIFGNLTESHLLGLVKASGHHLCGLQDKVDVHGIKGSRDCVIDGMLFDIKSASSSSFKKFARGQLRYSDPFGYISQISSYLYGSQSDPLVTYKTKAGFLVMDKQYGDITVDVYDLTEELEKKQEEVEGKKAIAKSDTPPPRPYKPKEDGKSGNMALPFECGWCEWKKACWPTLRTFMNANGETRRLVEVVREPGGSFMEV